MRTYCGQFTLDDGHLRRDHVVGRAGREEQRELVLAAVAVRQHASECALAKAIGYDKSRLIPLLDQLEREGPIVREPDPADRRAHTVRLTEAGQTRHAAAQAAIRSMETELLSALSAADQRSLFRMLSRLANEE